jgi:O-antigen/teichoic acid export membrane protein
VVLKLALSDFLPGLGWPVILIALLILPAALAALLLQGILLGEGRMLAYNLPQAVLSLATVACLVTVATVSHLTVTGAVAVMTAQWIVAVPIYYALAARAGATLPPPNFALARQMISYALRVYAATVLSFLVIRFDFFLVNTYLGARQAGLYSVVAGIAEGMFLLPIAIGMNIFFRVARGGEEQLTLSVFRSTIVLYGAFCLVAAAVAGPVIPLLFGEAYVGSVTLFYCLVPGIFSFGMLSILSNHFAGQGYPRKAIVYWAFGLGLNVTLNVALLNDLGTYFAALASSITYTVIFMLHVHLFAQEVGWRALRPRGGEIASVVRVVLGKRAD